MDVRFAQQFAQITLWQALTPESVGIQPRSLRHLYIANPKTGPSRGLFLYVPKGFAGTIRPSETAKSHEIGLRTPIVGAHDTGPLIRSKDGFWLAIPLPAAGKSLGGGRITPGEWERRRGLRLRFVYRRSGPSLLVAEGRLNPKGQAVVSRSKTGRGKVTAPIFLLVPQVKLPKRLDLARDAERAHDAVPGLIVANWVDR